MQRLIHTVESNLEPWGPLSVSLVRPKALTKWSSMKKRGILFVLLFLWFVKTDHRISSLLLSYWHCDWNTFVNCPKFALFFFTCNTYVVYKYIYTTHTYTLTALLSFFQINLIPTIVLNVHIYIHNKLIMDQVTGWLHQWRRKIVKFWENKTNI